ncbi:Tim44/TimA family putative adaptor protein [Candidatus Pelagibacter sp.]|nr:Tim44/TimA family putative adaptor protein [Candidatus Pelagibacter sp.]MDA9597640.1 Tim44/TimA family putative adaptor protein [Candidatus Pelagibacter sp.]
MSNGFEYIDIILLAMIAGFIFLRLRGILGKRTGFDGKISREFAKDFPKNIVKKKENPKNFDFDEDSRKDFLKGAKIAYETIITDFSDSDNKLINSKPLLGKKIYDQFKLALADRESKGHYAEITFIGVNSASIKEHKVIKNDLEVTVDFVSELITCIKDKDKKIISGDPEKIKKVYDTWKFSKDIRSPNPNWFLIDTIT